MINRNKLWSAPEVLRSDPALVRYYTNPSNPIFLDHQDPSEVVGSTKADVYSFSIILHEILVRQGVWGSTLDCREPDVIVGEIIVSSARPMLADFTLQPEMAAILTRCWAEVPADRMEFTAIKSELRRIYKDLGSTNILENLLTRMEKNAQNLEILVEERTQDYLEEKRRCEDLLYELLPKYVARKLINGEHVIAETFKSVTIYFSDIVGETTDSLNTLNSLPTIAGFTKICHSSSPLQVVDMLNDLYTLFDSIIPKFDVYKVSFYLDNFAYFLHIRPPATCAPRFLNVCPQRSQIFCS